MCYQENVLLIYLSLRIRDGVKMMIIFFSLSLFLGKQDPEVANDENPNGNNVSDVDTLSVEVLL